MHGRVVEDDTYTKHDVYEEVVNFPNIETWSEDDVLESEESVMERFLELCSNYHKDVEVDE